MFLRRLLALILFKMPYIFISDKFYLKLRYYVEFDKWMNLKKPILFNEKLQWLKLYDRKPQYINMVDKCEAKKYVSKRIGKQYIIPTLGVWEKFDDIDFNTLPEQFVLKCTHDSGGLVIVKDKNELDVAETRKKIEDALKSNYFWRGREWPYKNIKPRIIAEEYMSDEREEELLDYKLMCFNGKVRCSFVCTERNTKAGLKVTFFDTDWNPLPFERHYPRSAKEINKPDCYEEMVELAEKLAEGIPFVRVDFYEVHHKVYFGELTFFPGSGFEEFIPDEWDDKLGEWLILPTSEQGEFRHE